MQAAMIKQKRPVETHAQRSKTPGNKMKSLSGLTLPSVKSTASQRQNRSFDLQALCSDGLSWETAQALENALNTKHEGEKMGSSRGSMRNNTVSSSVDSGRSDNKSRGNSRKDMERAKVMV